jgi:hypothetical protein
MRTLLTFLSFLVCVCPSAFGDDGVVAIVGFRASSTNQIVNLSTNITVPSTFPPRRGTIFLWPGLDPGGSNYYPIDNGVLQPVLTWGPSCAPGYPNTLETVYNSWLISGQYVNTFGHEPGYIGCLGGGILKVNRGDRLLVTLTLYDTTWVQAINDLTTNQAVSYSLDMRNQSQNFAYFAIETYDGAQFGEDFEFRDTEITFSEANQLNCEVVMQGFLDTFTRPTFSDDGLTCTIKSIILRESNKNTFGLTYRKGFDKIMSKVKNDVASTKSKQ